jgi:hypothetical protein
VKLAGVPSGEASFVAGIAICNSDTRQSLVRNMICRHAVSWGEAACVATCALVGDR